MSNNFKRVSNANQNVHFSGAMFGEAEHSRMIADPIHLTTFNAGDIVPIYCREILPYQSIKMDLDFVIRQTTLLTPTMGSMYVDIYAFFVPNRIVNQSWKAVMGENLNGSWTANSISLATLTNQSVGSVQIPVGSVADHYGFPTQSAIPYSVLNLCHDLKFRGYLMIYNEHFRDQNYQPPISFSTLNIYNGFLSPVGTPISIVDSTPSTSRISTSNSVSRADGSFADGAILAAYSGNMSLDNVSGSQIQLPYRITSWSALDKPLKANKRHDYFTSVLPSPQKSQSSVMSPVSGSVSLSIPATAVTTSDSDISSTYSLLFKNLAGNVDPPAGSNYLFAMEGSDSNTKVLRNISSGTSQGTGYSWYPSNLATVGSTATGNVSGLGLSVEDLRMASAIQQVYEIQARGGSRYREQVASFFGIEADDPYSDIPRCLGHISRELDLFQTAQTSASVVASDGGTLNTPQGTLAAFGYTASSGHLFENLFLEHGYLHIFAVVRHRNVYSSYLARDNFRLSMLDFYTPPLANISEQPVYTREVNPFAPNPNGGFGYQEPWAEYRFEPDTVSGYMRNGISESLSLWNYSDTFDSSLQIADGNWLKSNSEDVLNRSLAVTSSLAPQFKGQFKFLVDKDLPMPTYSVPGMDII